MEKNYVQCEPFDDFLRMFETEEYKEVLCHLCNKVFDIRDSIEAEKYTCSSCSDNSLEFYKNGVMIESMSQINNDAKMKKAEQRIYEELQENGFVSLSNNSLENILELSSGVWEAKCFIIVEGIMKHFILNKKGATKLKELMIGQYNASGNANKKYRLDMLLVAMKQVNILIGFLD